MWDETPRNSIDQLFSPTYALIRLRRSGKKLSAFTHSIPSTSSDVTITKGNSKRRHSLAYIGADGFRARLSFHYPVYRYFAWNCDRRAMFVDVRFSRKNDLKSSHSFDTEQLRAKCHVSLARALASQMCHHFDVWQCALHSAFSSQCAVACLLSRTRRGAFVSCIVEGNCYRICLRPCLICRDVGLRWTTVACQSGALIEAGWDV